MKRKNEKGFALVLSLVLLMVMSLLGGSLIVITATDHQSNNSSDEYQQAFYVAETALLEGEKSVVNRMMGPWVNVEEEFVDVPTGMTEGEKEEWDSMVENIQNSAVLGMARNTDKRDLPTNTSAAANTPCFNSFRNINRAGFLVTEHQVNKNFGTLINAVFTDGDLRRCINQDIDIKNTKVSEVMSKSSKTIGSNDLAFEASKIMENHKIYSLIVINDDYPVGVVRMHDLLQAGLI